MQTIFPPTVQQSLVGKGFLNIEVSQSHSDTTHLVVLLWTSDETDAGTSTGKQHTQLTDERHPCHNGIQTRNPTKRAAPDRLLRSRGHWDRDPDFVIRK